MYISIFAVCCICKLVVWWLIDVLPFVEHWSLRKTTEHCEKRQVWLIDVLSHALYIWTSLLSSECDTYSLRTLRAHHLYWLVSQVSSCCQRITSSFLNYHSITNSSSPDKTDHSTAFLSRDFCEQSLFTRSCMRLFIHNIQIIVFYQYTDPPKETASNFRSSKVQVYGFVDIWGWKSICK